MRGGNVLFLFGRFVGLYEGGEGKVQEEKLEICWQMINQFDE